MKRTRKQAGYTLIEVMLSVSVLIVGATGFTLMQGASARAIQTAQEHTVALEVMETWVERVRRDASLWNAPGIANMQNTVYLRAGSLAWGTWITPAPVAEPATTIIATPSSDAWGWDRAAGRDARYCVKLMYQIAHWSAARGIRSEDAVRADVMVWRPRRGAAGALDLMESGGTDCNAEANLLTSSGVFKAVTSILVRWQ
jgi:Tfp pilus assembly protein PilV